ncbi:MAG: DUF4965 domain-containing protein, partial [Chthoniobacteraceae bacterium]
MNTFTRFVLGLAFAHTTLAAHAQDSQLAFRPPAVPLVAHDPYFSIWSRSDALNASNTTHWTGKPQTLDSLIRIDGQAFRLMGLEPESAPPLPQTKVEVLPTRTIYEFKNAQIAVTLTFTTPAIPGDLEIIARPVTYLTFEIRSADGAPHEVQIYTDASAELAVNEKSQEVVWNRADTDGLVALRIGSQDQPVLAKKGDDLRIDWGYFFLAAPKVNVSGSTFGTRASCMDEWTKSGKLSAQIDQLTPGGADVVAAVSFDLGKVELAPVSRMLMLAYDDEYSVTLMGRKLRPYWRRNGMDAAKLLTAAAQDYPALQKRCAEFDEELMADLRKVGGEKYARIAALAHRQALAANKIVADANGAPLMLSKENFSNGCIGTVDVLYPAAPQLLLLSPTLAKASMVPILAYAASPRWKFPFAPHDLGTYPRADGQAYGGGERTEDNQMPVEESGNMLLLLGAIAQIDGDARFAAPFWPQISQWAKYLEGKGFDPENQLCTDDFAGHLAHNVNLSAKAIEALGAYAMLCEMRGEKAEAMRVKNVAAQMAQRWVREAKDGDHFRLAFDKPGTWSQKYNLVWDRILGLKLFPSEVMREEMAFYRTKLNPYGLPLDNRKGYTKLDWTVWTGTLTGSRDDLETLVAPTFAFLNDTPQRNPMTDWHETREPKQVGFQARSVVGGVLIPLLGDAAVWKKWADRDRSGTGIKWAPLPTPPKVTEVVPSSQKSAVTWRYTFEKPADDWMAPDFKDTSWKSGPGGFGTSMTPGSVVRTEWKTDDIWLRREFTMPVGDTSKIEFFMYHDEDAEIYINGVLAAKVRGYNGAYEAI